MTEPLPPTAVGISGIIVSGSKASVWDDRPWIPLLEDLLRDARDRSVPVLGVCFGEQVLASALAGRDAVRVASRPEVGWNEIEVLAPDDPLFEGVASRFRTFCSHGDEVRSGLSGISVLARSAECPVQAIRVDDRPMWGVQFHAEMGAAETAAIVRRRVGQHPELNLDADAILREATDSAALARRIVGNWLGQVSA